VVVCVLDRPRNYDLIEAIRGKGASLRMIMDGDITAAMAPAMKTSTIDLYAGIGGAPECVLSAAGLRCLGGGMRAQIWPRDEDERKSLITQGWGDLLNIQYMSKDLARGNNIVFAATGISHSPLLKGVNVNGAIATTYSVLMRARSGTVRFIEGHHNLERKTIHLRSTQIERRI
jgi:fructose-1,6-bisphosphatase II